VRQSEEVFLEVFVYHSGLSPLQKIAPGHDLDLSVTDDQLFKECHLIGARIDISGSVDLPLFELIEKQFQPC
jgi:hypothetical protein